MRGLLPLIIGGLIGATYGMLYTKQSGADLRAHLKQSNNKVGDFFKAMFSADVAGIKNAAAGIASAKVVQDAWSKTKEVAGDVMEKGKEAVGSVADKAGEAVETVADKAKEGVETVADKVTGDDSKSV